MDVSLNFQKGKVGKVVSAALICAAVLLTIFLRLHTVEEPLQNDICIYAYIGHQMIAGDKLYTDLVDNKPPAIYYLYMLAEMIGGYEQSTYIWLGIIFTLLSMLFLILALSRIGGMPVAIFGAFIWAMASTSYRIDANHPNTELFINTFVFMTIWAMTEFVYGRKSYLWLAGLGLAIASVFKTSVLFLLLSIGVYFIWKMISKEEKNTIKQGLLELNQLVLPGAIMWLLMFLVFKINGNFNDFYDVVFKALKEYAGNIILNEFNFFAGLPVMIFTQRLREIAILFFLTAGWLVWPDKNGIKGLKIMLVLFLLGGLIMNGSTQFISHYYYQLLLPSLCVISALFLNRLVRYLGLPKSKRWGALTIALITILGYLIYFQIQYLKMSPQQVSAAKYSDRLLKEKSLGIIIGELTLPEEKIYQWGMSSSIYFFSKRKAASGIVINHILYFTNKKLTLKYMNKILNDLLVNKPAFFIISAWIGQLGDHKIFNNFSDEYQYFGSFGKNIIFERKGRQERFEDKINNLINSNREYGLTALKYKLRLAEDQTLDQYNPNKKMNRNLIEPEGLDEYSLLVKEGNQLARNKWFDKALVKWSAARQIYPKRLEALANNAIIQEMKGELHPALEAYEILAKQYGAPWDAYFSEAVLYLEKQAKEAIERTSLKKSLKDRKLLGTKLDTEYGILINQGLEQIKRNQFDEAEKCWLKAVVVDPEGIEARANLGVIRERTRRFKLALEDYEFVAEHKGEPWIGYYNELKKRMNNK